MATTLNFKDLIDLPEWRPLAYGISTGTAGRCLAYDLRNNTRKDPFIYLWGATTIIDAYHKKNDEWFQLPTFTAVGGAVAAGSGATFVPSHGPAGTIGGTPTTTSFTLAALPNAASVAAGELANRGDGDGYYIRVIGSGAGGSGKTEIRQIVANTSGTTPVVYLDSALSFTPQTTDKYEVISGRIYMLGSGTTTALGYWKAFDIATNSISGNLSITNLAAAIATDYCGVALDEQYVPYDRQPGEGFLIGAGTYNGGLLGCLTATASAAGTLTGQATGGDAGVLANEYARFQIRIVEDTGTPTAVGQRRTITSHTAGASPVYTLNTNWTVTPSATAKYVIENNNDLLLWTNTAAVTYSYRAGGYAADGAWSTAAVNGNSAYQYANPPAAMGAGCCAASCFSIEPDIAKSARHSHVVWFRGGATTTMAILDTAANTFTSVATYGSQTTTYTTGTSFAQDAATNSGKYLYVNVNGTQRFVRFDLLNKVTEPFCYLRFAQSTVTVGGKCAIATYIDGSTKVGFLYHLRHTGAEWFNVLLQR